MTRHKTSIGLSLFGGIVGIVGTLFFLVIMQGFDLMVMYKPSMIVCVWFFGGICLFSVLGALIESKNKEVGSVICLLSGLLLLIIVIIYQEIIYWFLEFLVGGNWYIISVILGILVLILVIGDTVGFIEWFSES